MNTLQAMPVPIKQGVAEAIIKCRTQWGATVLCPFCKTYHKHGLAGLKTLVGQFRSADCHRGDYQIV